MDDDPCESMIISDRNMHCCSHLCYDEVPYSLMHEIYLSILQYATCRCIIQVTQVTQNGSKFRGKLQAAAADIS
jgi:hypothetical protein